jgi:DNA-binding NarL/FixJ family response regulator
MAQLLTTEFPHCTVNEASTAAEGLEAILNESWNLVLLDISLPGRNGLELLKEIKAARPKLPVLILSTYSESQFATRVLKAGAAGYLTKESPPETVVRAVRQVLTGSKFISQWVAERLASEIMLDTSKPAHELLSDREYDVMLRIASGQAVGEIASTLNLSVKTISTYRTRVLEKMGMKNNAELMQYAIRNTLIE